MRSMDYAAGQHQASFAGRLQANLVGSRRLPADQPERLETRGF
ncbi:hypothetical protein RESH_02954 [Rhodopirellula europaea SH398]|uniref:Uncharacterized protein n=1 Tax=Rhodopirellula europaea SH398 TaxID=1263868 RepID=M5SJR3_9BACT|nr:hypothetical protein RESH_02954 [Rhodopirellula europaea SH398]